MNEKEIFEKVNVILTGVIGDEFIEEYNVTLESTLTGDLEMESIEIVELSEKIKKQFGESVEINKHLAKLSIDELVNLSIKDIVKYIGDVID